MFIAGWKSIIDSDVANDPCAAANAPVPGGFAGFSAVPRFIGNADINNACAQCHPEKAFGASRRLARLDFFLSRRDSERGELSGRQYLRRWDH